jgi:hypothetical protein
LPLDHRPQLALRDELTEDRGDVLRTHPQRVTDTLRGDRLKPLREVPRDAQHLVGVRRHRARLRSGVGGGESADALACADALPAPVPILRILL